MHFRPLSDPDRYAPRFTEISTYMRAPFAKSVADAATGIFGITYDGALTTQAAARHRLRETRKYSSLLRAKKRTTLVDPFDHARPRDMGMSL